MTSRGNLVKLSVFVVVTALLITLIGLTLGRVRIEDSVRYHALFTDGSGIGEGVEVRAAGVPVGTVTGAELTGDHLVDIEFTAPKNLPLSSDVRARIRWANLTGDRYLEILDSSAGRGSLQPGGTIPLARTQPALDLDTLFGGFKPLIQALDPDDVNELTRNLIAVTQGRGGAIEQLLQQVGSLTQTLADRDDLIGDVIVNFGSAIGAVADREAEFDDLIVQLGRVMRGLADDKEVIGSAVTELSGLTTETAGLLRDIRPDVKGVLDETNRLAQNLNDNRDEVDKNLTMAPEVIRKLSRVGAYGTFTNFYLCGVRVVFTGPFGDAYTPWINSGTPRCQS